MKTVCGWLAALAVASTGCAAMSSSGESGEQRYFDAVAAGREPGFVADLRAERTSYLVVVGWGSLSEGVSDDRVAVEVDQAARDSLAEKVKPWVVDVLETYGDWFTWSERRPQGELVSQIAGSVTRGSVKAWDRFYYGLKRYQVVRCLHRHQVEVQVLAQAIPREGAKGGRQVQDLVRRMEYLQNNLGGALDRMKMMGP